MNVEKSGDETAADIINTVGNLICINAFEENVPFKTFMVMGNKYNPPEPNLLRTLVLIP